MNKVRNLATVLGGIIALFTFNPPADAATGPASVCETGYRGMPAYDRECLTRGTVLDGVKLWFYYIGTDKPVPARERRALCREATATGNTRAGIVDGLNDVAYDHFRNYRFVLRVAGTVGVMDCRALGVKISK